ncbi:hypothetical protein [Halostreptopolyspora alba]|uniref:hypothetical protein n=1 Tax=Halostreptopolyspora alba TaxID=2487137 RepID=UPI0011CE41DD
MGLRRAAEIWSALSARPFSAEETAALLPEPDDSATLVEIARLALRSDACATGPYLHAVLDRLPSSLLRELAERAVHRLTSGPNDAAAEILAYVSVHQAESLAAHLPSLWELSPSEGFYFAEWPWRVADESEIARLWERADPDDELRRERALRCLLQTRRPDVLARLSPAEDDLHSVGYTLGGGELRRLHSASPWHLAFPADLLRRWATRNPLRAHQSSWPVASQRDPQALTSGCIDLACPRCRKRLHRLLYLPSVPPDVGVTSRARVEFVWCAECGPYTEVSYVRHDADGAPADLAMTFVVDPPERQPGLEPADEAIPATGVELVRLEQRWWWQDWAISNDRENLHRVGGEPTWIQDPDYPSCPDCADTMIAAGQVNVADLWDFEGMCYLMWCDQCAISGVVYQQT